MLDVKFSKIRETALYPTKATKYSACWDLCAAERTLLKPGETKVIPTGLVVKMPDNYCMSILSRSGLSAKGIIVANAPGRIDFDYTCDAEDDPFKFEIKVILHNLSQIDYLVQNGERIAQAEFFQVDDNVICWQIEDYKNLNKRIDYDPTNQEWFQVGVSGTLNLCEAKDKKREGGLGHTGK